MENAPIIYFVVPCYNEEEVLPLTAGILGKKLVTLINAGVIGEESRILLVDDGSRAVSYTHLTLPTTPYV